MSAYSSRSLGRITRELTSEIEDDLLRVGIFYRIFSRAKSESSVERKIEIKNYDGQKTFLQDIIGIRVNFYFIDDLDIVYNYLKNKDNFLGETIDRNEATEFKPTRINLVFKVPTNFEKEFRDLVEDKRIDSTFEVQLRTVLSEGWHEVDHDLRYKCPDDWLDHNDLSRFFNGILASLETSDWSILNLFDRISYRHYKATNLSAMLRTKFRIRINDAAIQKSLEDIIKGDVAISKAFFKMDRAELIKTMLTGKYLFPINLTNLTFVANAILIKNDSIIAITPEELLKSVTVK